MGQRLYNPTTGRFQQTDPIPGGSANNYDYCNQDPINCTDLNGQWGWHHHWKHFLKRHWRGIVQIGVLGGCVVTGAFWCAGIGVVAAGVTSFRREHGHLRFDRKGFAIDAAFALAGGGAGRYGERFLTGVYRAGRIPRSVRYISNGLVTAHGWAGNFVGRKFFRD